MLRAYHRETCSADHGRRYPKSVGYRNKMTTTDYEMMEMLCGLMGTPDVTDDAVGPLPEPPALCDAQSEPTGTESRWPACFAPTVHDTPIAPKAHHDTPEPSDYWPDCFRPAGFVTPPKAPINDRTDPTTPVAALRKRQARAKSESSSPHPQRKSKGKGKGKSKAKKPPVPLYFKPIERVFLRRRARDHPELS